MQKRLIHDAVFALAGHALSREIAALEESVGNFGSEYATSLTVLWFHRQSAVKALSL